MNFSSRIYKVFMIFIVSKVSYLLLATVWEVLCVVAGDDVTVRLLRLCEVRAGVSAVDSVAKAVRFILGDVTDVYISVMNLYSALS